MRSDPGPFRKHVCELARLFTIGLCALAFAACGDDSGQTFDCTEQGVRDAVAAAGGVHTFSCDGPTVVETGDEIVIDRNVVLDGRGELILDGRDRHRVLSIEPAVKAELRGFGIQGGDTDSNDSLGGSGGGILNQGDLTLRDSQLTSNRSERDGGGAFSTEGRLTLIDTDVEFNTADDGGGLFVVDGELRIVGGSFKGNTVEEEGGAIVIRGGNQPSDVAVAAIEGAHFISNNAFIGAAIAVLTRGELTVERSIIEGNFALETQTDASVGGGFYVEGDGRLTIRESTLRGNGASWGGGIYAGNTAQLRVEASTFDQNTAEAGGGIRSTDAAVIDIVNSTFWRNGSANLLSVGGGLMNDGTARIVHSTFKRNAADLSEAIYNYGDLDLRNTYMYGGCSSSSSGTITVLHSYSRTSSGCAGVNAVGMAAVYGDLGANGGPTDTIPLTSGVTVDVVPIDDCDDAFGVPVWTDQRGVRRPYGEGCDVGAFEIRQ